MIEIKPQFSRVANRIGYFLFIDGAQIHSAFDSESDARKYADLYAEHLKVREALAGLYDRCLRELVDPEDVSEMDKARAALS